VDDCDWLVDRSYSISDLNISRLWIEYMFCHSFIEEDEAGQQMWGDALDLDLRVRGEN